MFHYYPSETFFRGKMSLNTYYQGQAGGLTGWSQTEKLLSWADIPLYI